MKPTAIGHYIGICLAPPDLVRWMVVAFDRRGNWASMSTHATRAAAQAERRRIRRHHAKYAETRRKGRGA